MVEHSDGALGAEFELPAVRLGPLGDVAPGGGVFLEHERASIIADSERTGPARYSSSRSRDVMRFDEGGLRWLGQEFTLPMTYRAAEGAQGKVETVAPESWSAELPISPDRSLPRPELGGARSRCTCGTTSAVIPRTADRTDLSGHVAPCRGGTGGFVREEVERSEHDLGGRDDSARLNGLRRELLRRDKWVDGNPGALGVDPSGEAIVDFLSGLGIRMEASSGLVREDRRLRPTTITSPDSRIFGNSWTYPRRCVGQIRIPDSLGSVSSTFASASLVGERVVLTVGHSFVTNPNPIPAVTRFTVICPPVTVQFPYMPAPVTVGPFTFQATAVDFNPLKIQQPTTHARCSTDIAVLRLGSSVQLSIGSSPPVTVNIPMGKLLGKFGFADISDSWDVVTAAQDYTKSNLLSEAGVVGTQLESNLSSCSLLDGTNYGVWSDPDGGFALAHDCDIVPGHSGGPIFLMNSPTNAVVIGVQSSEIGDFKQAINVGGWLDPNCAAGGWLMFSKIKQEL